MTSSEIKELAAFIVQAHQKTYANKSASKTTSTRLGSNDYHFEKDDRVYHDTYFGSRDFIGEEVVYQAHRPQWGMNYYGYILSSQTDERELYSFLREALMQEPEGIIPVRGPSIYRKGEWQYKNSVMGELSRFSGTEEIYLHDTLLYKALFHGGFIE